MFLFFFFWFNKFKYCGRKLLVWNCWSLAIDHVEIELDVNDLISLTDDGRFRPLNLARGWIEIHCEYSLRTDFACVTRVSIAVGQTEMKMFISVDRFLRPKCFHHGIPSDMSFQIQWWLIVKNGPRLPVYTPEIYLRAVKHIHQYTYCRKPCEIFVVIR